MAKILVADDEAPIRSLLQTFLELNGHDVCLAESGPDALEKFSGFKPDLLLTDFSMGSMTGADLITALRKELPELKAFILSGSLSGTRLSPTVLDDLGNPTVIYKPFRLDEVLEQITAAVS